MRRLLALVAVAVAAAVWAGAAAHDWWFGHAQPARIAADPNRDPAAATLLPPVWGHADAARRLARSLRASEDSALRAAAQSLLTESLGLRPLHAPTWLDLAELQSALGDDDAALRSLSIARALWPSRPVLLGRAAWLLTTVAPPDAALQGLMDYWAVAPQNAPDILELARQISGNPETLIDAAETLWRAHPETAPAYQAALMRAARAAGDVELARSLWQRLPGERRTDESVLFPYLRLLIAQDAALEADAIWQRVTGDPPGVVNGGFEQPLVPLGPEFRPDWATAGWRYHPAGRGVRIGRDADRAASGRFSLRLDFDGTENVHLREPSQMMRVRPGTRYRLLGTWAGEGLTTRSGVYVALERVDAQPHTRVETPARWGSWDWTPFALDIDPPDDALVLRLSIGRNRTNAFDRHIAGTLWLDDLRLVPRP